MNFVKRLYSFNDDIDFRKGWRIAAVLSAITIVAGIIALSTAGLNLGIDFKGGTAWQFSAHNTSVNKVRDALKPIGGGAATIQTLDLAGDKSIRVELGTSVDREKASAAMATATNQSVIAINANRSEVGPSWGRDVSKKALRALIVFFIAIAFYITWKLEWRMAAGALLAVVHDIVISVGVYAILQIEVTPGTVVAFLTVLGYSLYDTIVVYDKVAENQTRLSTRGDMTYTDMMNLSLNQAFMRSINTTLSTIIPVMSILVIGAWGMGALTLEEFGIALLVGLFVGAYSSVFVASPIVALLKEREPRYRAIRAHVLESRAAAGVGSSTDASPAEGAEGDDSKSDEPSQGAKVGAGTESGDPATKPITSPYSSKHPPRPRKQGKKR